MKKTILLTLFIPLALFSQEINIKYYNIDDLEKEEFITTIDEYVEYRELKEYKKDFYCLVNYATSIGVSKQDIIESYDKFGGTGRIDDYFLDDYNREFIDTDNGEKKVSLIGSNNIENYVYVLGLLDKIKNKDEEFYYKFIKLNYDPLKFQDKLVSRKRLKDSWKELKRASFEISKVYALQNNDEEDLKESIRELKKLGTVYSYTKTGASFKKLLKAPYNNLKNQFEKCIKE